MASRIALSGAAAATLFVLTACEERTGSEEVGEAVPAPTDLTRVAAATDQAFITLDGSIVSAGPNAFVLDYGSGRITVEMDDWDAFREGQFLKAGDMVTVSGRFDRDLYEASKLEASSVYVQSLGAAFYADPVDEETLRAVVVRPRNVDVIGRVENIEGRELTLGSERGDFKVDTGGMSQNPLDEAGFPKVRQGDRIYVWGDLRLAGQDSELMAEGIIKLSSGRGQNSTQATKAG